MTEAVAASADTGTTLLGGDAPAATAVAATTAPATTVVASTAATPATTEPTAEEKAAAEKAATEKAATEKVGAPEAYEAFELPEGVKLDDALVGEFSQIAKELNLPQDAAQKLVSLGAKMQTGNAEAMKAAIESQGEAWGKEALADKEFGGDKFQENLAVAKTALDKFGSPELKTLLVQSKLGNHPEVLRFFVRAGQAISQDGFVPGRTGTGGRKDTADVLYTH